MQTVCLGNCASRHGFHCRMGVTESQCKWGDLANLLQNSTALRGSDDVFFISFNHNLQNSQIPIFFGEHEPRLFVTDLKNLHGVLQGFKKKQVKGKVCHPTSRTPPGAGSCCAGNTGGGAKPGFFCLFLVLGSNTGDTKLGVMCRAKGGASNKRARQESVTSRARTPKNQKSGRIAQMHPAT